MSAEPAATALPSLWDLARSGGPLMIPIAVCSVAALGTALERAISLRRAKLGSPGLETGVLSALRAGDEAAALRACDAETTPLSRILRTALASPPELRDERASDTATSEVKSLQARLRPLLLVYLIAPLLGLLGTVWGMIGAFASVAHRSGLGRPEVLAAGVYQALVTTAAGLAVAIPVLLVHQGLRARIDRFARRVEGIWREVERARPVGVAAGAHARLASAEVPRADP
jgi:biopolymer transport protein ExbB